jgi:hypothetical protein
VLVRPVASHTVHILKCGTVVLLGVQFLQLYRARVGFCDCTHIRLWCLSFRFLFGPPGRVNEFRRISAVQVPSARSGSVCQTVASVQSPVHIVLFSRMTAQCGVSRFGNNSTCMSSRIFRGHCNLGTARGTRPRASGSSVQIDYGRRPSDFGHIETADECPSFGCRSD